jgi:hypothetical protein
VSRVRVKSHWFRSAGEKGAAEIAGAAAFIVFRIAQNSLKNMRGASFELPAGERYFAFLAEFLAFLVLGADRIAHARGDGAWRVEFTTALANRVGEILAENESELLGGASAAEVKRRFVALVNERSPDYADCGWGADGPDYAFLRCLGHSVAEVMEEREATWAIPQVIDVEAPEAAMTLVRAMAGLTGATTSPWRAATGTQGE